jgi:hypothetical protein
MSRYVMLWKYDTSYCPTDTKEKVNQWLMLTDAVKNLLKKGTIKEWAHYVGEPAGFIIVEGNESDVMRVADSYLPYIRWTVKSLTTIEQCEAVWKSL